MAASASTVSPSSRRLERRLGQAKQRHRSRGVKFQSEFLGATTMPNQVARATAPAAGPARAVQRIQTVKMTSATLRTMTTGSTGKPRSGGLVQGDVSPRRLMKPLIDWLLQYGSGPSSRPLLAF